MLNWRIAIVPSEASIDFDEVRRVADAIQRQVTEDFAPWWGIGGVVTARRKVEDVPDDYFVIQLVETLSRPTLEGFHYFDQLGQPHALVRVDRPEWSLAVSHETLEMLADPTGNLTRPAPPLGETTGLVEYLQEVCDPCQNRAFAYRLNGILVSDFYGPEYFDSVARPGLQYSITGSITKPRQLLPGGYICYSDGQRGWIRATLKEGHVSATQVAGAMDLYSRSIREFVDEESRQIGAADMFRRLRTSERRDDRLGLGGRGNRGSVSSFSKARHSVLKAFLHGRKAAGRKRSSGRERFR
jgi:hypothetical protein